MKESQKLTYLCKYTFLEPEFYKDSTFKATDVWLKIVFFLFADIPVGSFLTRVKNILD